MSADWDDVRRRLDAAADTLAREDAPSTTERRAILEARARALAREPAKATAASESLEVVVFSLASENYAIESKYIREVQPLKSCTPLPGAPSFVLGIVNARGRIISVVDLKKFFDLPEKGLGERDKVIVIGDDQMEFGVLADAVIGARAIPFAEIYPPIPTLSKIGSEYLKGIADARVIVIDAERLLGDEAIVICQEADLSGAAP